MSFSIPANYSDGTNKITIRFRSPSAENGDFRAVSRRE
jgi:hypothetical protein